MKRWLLFAGACLLGAAALPGCRQEWREDPVTERRFITVHGGLEAGTVLTRSVIRLEDDFQYRDVVLFAFASGEESILTDEAGEPVILHLEDNARIFEWRLPEGACLDIYAVANNGTMDAVRRAGLRRSELENLVFTCPSLESLNTAFLPMSARTSVREIGPETVLHIRLRHLFARYDISLDLSQLRAEGETLRGGTLRIRNMNRSVRWFGEGDRAVSGADLTDGDRATDLDWDALENGAGISLYVLENCQGRIGAARSWDEVHLEEGLDCCTYAEFSFDILRTQGPPVTKSYLLYLGKDLYRNFDIERNHRTALVLKIDAEAAWVALEADWRNSGTPAYLAQRQFLDVRTLPEGTVSLSVDRAHGGAVLGDPAVSDDLRQISFIGVGAGEETVTVRALDAVGNVLDSLVLQTSVRNLRLSVEPSVPSEPPYELCVNGTARDFRIRYLDPDSGEEIPYPSFDPEAFMEMLWPQWGIDNRDLRTYVGVTVGVRASELHADIYVKTSDHIETISGVQHADEVLFWPADAPDVNDDGNDVYVQMPFTGFPEEGVLASINNSLYLIERDGVAGEAASFRKDGNMYAFGSDGWLTFPHPGEIDPEVIRTGINLYTDAPDMAFMLGPHTIDIAAVPTPRNYTYGKLPVYAEVWNTVTRRYGGKYCLGYLDVYLMAEFTICCSYNPRQGHSVFAGLGLRGNSARNSRFQSYVTMQNAIEGHPLFKIREQVFSAWYKVDRGSEVDYYVPHVDGYGIEHRGEDPEDRPMLDRFTIIKSSAYHLTDPSFGTWTPGSLTLDYDADGVIARLDGIGHGNEREIYSGYPFSFLEAVAVDKEAVAAGAFHGVQLLDGKVLYKPSSPYFLYHAAIVADPLCLWAY